MGRHQNQRAGQPTFRRFEIRKVYDRILRFAQPFLGSELASKLRHGCFVSDVWCVSPDVNKTEQSVVEMRRFERQLPASVLDQARLLGSLIRPQLRLLPFKA